MGGCNCNTRIESKRKGATARARNEKINARTVRDENNKNNNQVKMRKEKGNGTSRVLELIGYHGPTWIRKVGDRTLS